MAKNAVRWDLGLSLMEDWTMLIAQMSFIMPLRFEPQLMYSEYL